MLTTHDYQHFTIRNPDTGETELEFEGAKRAERALPGDRVYMSDTEKLVLLERAPKKNLVGILRLTGKYMYGMTGHGVPLYLCEPLAASYPPFRVACRETDKTVDRLIVFQFDTWELGNEMPRGALVEILGTVEDEAAHQRALEILACPWTAPIPLPEALPQPSEPVQDRRWLTTGTFNIDPPGCRDIDDVFTLTRHPTEEDVWEFWITIANVAETVFDPTPMYKVAQKIGATTYTPSGNAVRPMLHRRISEEACSLLPHQVRHGVALGVEFDRKRRLVRLLPFERVYVVNQESYTYDTIQFSKTVPLDVLRDICAYIADRPETDDPHTWVENAMVFYNTEAARVLHAIGHGLLRIHDAPIAEKVAQIERLGRSDLAYLAYTSAEYGAVATTTDTRHFGLKTDLYCHATSPLRRFADVYNQHLLCYMIQGILERIITTPLQEQRLAVALNRRMREIAHAEREMAFRAVLGTAESGTAEALVLWEEKGKVALWVAAWKMLLKKRLEGLRPGEIVAFSYYADTRKIRWKERMVLQLSAGKELLK